MCADQVMDLRNGLVRLCYNPNFDDLKEDYLKNLTATLKMFSDFLATKSWLVGEQITYPDFHFYEMLDQHKQLDPTCLKEFPNLEAYLDRFQRLPDIEAYMKSDRFMKAPLNNKMAKFGSE
jgi:glutathione S-transferase